MTFVALVDNLLHEILVACLLACIWTGQYNERSVIYIVKHRVTTTQISCPREQACNGFNMGSRDDILSENVCDVVTYIKNGT